MVFRRQFDWENEFSDCPGLHQDPIRRLNLFRKLGLLQLLPEVDLNCSANRVHGRVGGRVLERVLKIPSDQLDHQENEPHNKGHRDRDPAQVSFIVGISTRTAPRFNYTNDPYYTDGLRIVLFLSVNPVAYKEVNWLDWEQPTSRLTVMEPDE